jgi:8-oxo-dGTP pyrophosphatase MutT (NUDIX family)/N-acetylglutamate synthase-like GNAT family acetyltransferase
MDDERQAYSDEYAAEHGRFALIPAAYVFLLEGERGDAGERVLLQRRAGTGYYDDWWAAAAAGHVEPGETVLAAAVRETAEELGVDVVELALEPLTAMHRTGGTGRPVDERLDVFFACRSWQGAPTLMEQKATGLEWFRLDALPEHVVHHERFVLEGYRDGTLLPLTAYGFGDEPGVADAVADDARTATSGADRVVGRPAASGAEPVFGPATPEDVPALIAFWAEAGENDGRPTDRPEAVARLLARDPDALIVARVDGRIVGTVIAGYDGWRAHLYRLAVAPDQRRRGIGRELLRRGEERLSAFGAARFDAMVLEHNEVGRSLWSSLGFTEQLDWRRWVRTPWSS